MTMAEPTAVSNDRELWREPNPELGACSIHVTETGGIGIDVGGSVIVKSLREWHKLAALERHSLHIDDERLTIAARVLGRAIRDLIVGDNTYSNEQIAALMFEAINIHPLPPPEPVEWRYLANGKGFWKHVYNADAAAKLAEENKELQPPKRHVIEPLYTSPPPSVWMDIDTAPKDGTWFIGWDGRYRDIWRWDASAKTDGDDGWWVNQSDDNMDNVPTHWAPLLPSPPQQEGK